MQIDAPQNLQVPILDTPVELWTTASTEERGSAHAKREEEQPAR
jgi:hypothetical protein|tara:strand:+ start:591 stop:722 length:132 start_codon:yes stop_codon:yes gene_type:complete